jgi:hypothetical protein
MPEFGIIKEKLAQICQIDALDETYYLHERNSVGGKLLGGNVQLVPLDTSRRPSNLGLKQGSGIEFHTGI